MPYKSAKQRGWMHIHLPEIAKKWDAEIRAEKEKVAKTNPSTERRKKELKLSAVVGDKGRE